MEGEDECGTPIFATSGAGSSTSFTWDASAISPGTHTLSLMVQDGRGHTATAIRHVTVASAASLNVSPESVAPDASVTATWSSITSATPTDWIGLYSHGATDTAYLAWIYVSCSHTPTSAKASGSCAFALPTGLMPGMYELWLMANNGYTRLAMSNPFSVTVSGPRLNASPSSVGGGGAVTMTWSDIPSPTGTDWIGIYAAGAADSAFLAWVYVSCTHAPSVARAAGSCAFAVPSLPPGPYELRLLSNNGFTRLAASNTVTITAGTPTLGISASNVPAGGSVSATWSNIAAPSVTDWIGLYAPGAADSTYLTWIYVSCTQAPGAARAAGSCPLALPGSLPLGTYELRLLANNGYVRLASSNPFTIDNGENYTKPTFFGRAALESLERLLPELEDGDWGALVVTGKPFVFAAGADITQFPGATRELAIEGSRAGHELFGRIRALPYPTVAAINGACLGGGVELALHCDARTISTAVRHFACPECFLGIVPAWGGTQLVPRLVGVETAVTFIVENPMRQNRMLSGPKAFELGFADRLLEPAEFLDESIAFARELAANGDSPRDSLRDSHRDGHSVAEVIRNALARLDDQVHAATPAPYNAS